MEDDIEEGTVHVQPTVVFQEAKFAKLVHEEIHAGPRGADHLSQHFLTDLRNDRFRLALFPEVRQQQQHSRQPLFAGIKELISHPS